MGLPFLYLIEPNSQRQIQLLINRIIMEGKITASITLLPQLAQNRLEELSQRIETELDCDLICFNSYINKASAQVFNETIIKMVTKSRKKNKRLVILLNTNGGESDEVVNMVNNIRRFYEHVLFIITKSASSAGTLFSFSGNEIYMQKTSSLGPIDLQVGINGKEAYPFKVMKKLARKVEGLTLGKKALTELSLSEQYEFNGFDNLKYYHRYDENYQFQETVRHIAKEYLTTYKFPAFENLDQQEKDKIASIVDKLIDDDLMKENGLFFHSTEMFIEQSNKLGLQVKDLEQDLPKVYIDINEFDQLCNEYAWLRGRNLDYVIYNHLVPDIHPIEDLQPEKSGKK
jgi:hypothetical protein